MMKSGNQSVYARSSKSFSQDFDFGVIICEFRGIAILSERLRWILAVPRGARPYLSVGGPYNGHF